MPRQSLSDTRTPIYTALPASPYDGQVIDYLADATNGVVWRLRYRAASASAYKWEFVGGSVLQSRAADGSMTVAAVNNTWNAPAGWPALGALPLAGDWDFEFGGGIGISQSARDCRIGLFVAGVLQAQVFHIEPTVTGWSGTAWQSPAATRRVTSVAAGASAYLGEYTSDYTNASFQLAWIRAHPVRVG